MNSHAAATGKLYLILLYTFVVVTTPAPAGDSTPIFNQDVNGDYQWLLTQLDSVAGIVSRLQNYVQRELLSQKSNVSIQSYGSSLASHVISSSIADQQLPVVARDQPLGSITATTPAPTTIISSTKTTVGTESKVASIDFGGSSTASGNNECLPRGQSCTFHWFCCGDTKCMPQPGSWEQYVCQ